MRITSMLHQDTALQIVMDSTNADNFNLQHEATLPIIRMQRSMQITSMLQQTIFTVGILRNN